MKFLGCSFPGLFLSQKQKILDPRICSRKSQCTVVLPSRDLGERERRRISVWRLTAWAVLYLWDILYRETQQFQLE